MKEGRKEGRKINGSKGEEGGRKKDEGRNEERMKKGR